MLGRAICKATSPRWNSGSQKKRETALPKAQATGLGFFVHHCLGEARLASMHMQLGNIRKRKTNAHADCAYAKPGKPKT